jgi:hypothetical protein
MRLAHSRAAMSAIACTLARASGRKLSWPAKTSFSESISARRPKAPRLQEAKVFWGAVFASTLRLLLNARAVEPTHQTAIT